MTLVAIPRLRPFTTVATTLAAVALALGLSACGDAQPADGTAQQPSPSGSSSVDADSTAGPGPAQGQIVQADDLVVAQGSLYQKSSTSPVELCFVMAQSYPPQCSGPTVVGDIDWDALKPERASGVTWTGMVWVVGTYDPDAGEQGTVTLDRAPSLTPPPGAPSDPDPRPSDGAFPQLCEDPYAGGGRKGGGTPEQQAALSQKLESLDGYIGSWVSNGSDLYNVLVTGDAAAAHKELRTVWPGGLCVEQRDAPTQADLTAAQEALTKAGLGITTAPDAQTGRLTVRVTALDQATWDKVLTTVEPWLAPKDLAVTSEFQPYAGG
ncbi:hypothetical protein BCF74_12615 [Knoellia remsis]|uniref:Uncharacterized protein n=1 Tax=Knoellia remsis TaxID=407159 RepID=A0A2T0U7U9_9MICO|nr:hypothetical protein [Knoellia remsis]PRY54001.1 hypothetical protein BCF74_12615 [Knoellia remsis]